MLVLKSPDLRADAAACWVMKDEIVAVEFAADAGTLDSAVGLNRYHAGDAIVTGATGDRWSVSRTRFDAKYHPLPPTRAGQPGQYRNHPARLRGLRMSMEFCVERTVGGDVLHGHAGDWLVQYAPGDHGIVAASRFDSVYRVVGPEGRPA